MDSITTRLVSCFRSVFPALSEVAIREASQDSVSSWDSVAMINLISIIEDEFQIAMDYERVEATPSFAGIADFLNQTIGSKS